MQCNIKYNTRFIFNFLAGKSVVFLGTSTDTGNSEIDCHVVSVVFTFTSLLALLDTCFLRVYLSLISQQDSHDEVGGGKGGEKFQSFYSTLPDR